MTNKTKSVYTLVVQVVRSKNDVLPNVSTGAGLLCYASGIDEPEAVRETVAILKQADLAPLDVTGHGTVEDRLTGREEIGEEELNLMERAENENSVIVAQMTPFFEN